MTAEMIALMCVAGGLGAVCRWAWGQTLGINLLGSLLAGIVSALGGEWAPIVATGFLGGFTTFSTAMVEHVDAAAVDRRRAWTQTLTMLVGCLLAAWVGVVLGRGFAR